MLRQAPHLYEFGPFRLDIGERVLMRDGEIVPLTPKALDLLVALVEHSSHVLSKDELMKQVWPDSYVEEANLSHHIFTLRKALGEEKNGSKFIETVPRRGYRFVARVAEVQREGIDTVVTEHSRSHLVIEEEVTDEIADAVPEANLPEKALTTGQNQRHSSARKLSSLVLIAGTLMIALGFALYFWLSGTSRQEQIGLGLKSIAVLPFKPLVTESRDEALELRMAETLISNLSKLRELSVKPTSAVRKYTDLHQDAVVAGRELQVESVLDTSIQKSGDRLRVVARLIRTKDGATLWSDKFDEKFTDIFAVQDRIAERITAALVLRPAGEDRKLLTKRDTESVEAYQLYMRGRYFWDKFTADGVSKSVELFGQAIDKDPNYARAYAGLANAYNVLGVNHLPPKDFLPKVKYAAEKSVALDDRLAEAHLSLGAFKLFYEWDWPGAERAFKRSIELDPSYIQPYELQAYLLRTMGRFDEALTLLSKARELDPVSLLVGGDIGETLRLARRYEAAIEEFRRTLELDPNFADALPDLGITYAEIGRYEEAVSVTKKGIALSGNSTQAIAILGRIHALSGNNAEAHKVIAELQEISRRRYVGAIDIAMIYAVLGEKDQAFSWLEKAFEEHSCWLIELGIEPVWDKLRPDPRFAVLLHHVGLPQ
jgi:DNA-binding winged helix-turn-helix (wHTH) protein/TolB-like protein/Flp pilus assembly protein TadD